MIIVCSAFLIAFSDTTLCKDRNASTCETVPIFDDLKNSDVRPCLLGNGGECADHRILAYPFSSVSFSDLGQLPPADDDVRKFIAPDMLMLYKFNNAYYPYIYCANTQTERALFLHGETTFSRAIARNKHIYIYAFDDNSFFKYASPCGDTPLHHTFGDNAFADEEHEIVYNPDTIKKAYTRGPFKSYAYSSACTVESNLNFGLSSLDSCDAIPDDETHYYCFVPSACDDCDFTFKNNIFGFRFKTINETVFAYRKAIGSDEIFTKSSPINLDDDRTYLECACASSSDPNTCIGYFHFYQNGALSTSKKKVIKITGTAEFESDENTKTTHPTVTEVYMSPGLATRERIALYGMIDLKKQKIIGIFNFFDLTEGPEYERFVMCAANELESCDASGCYRAKHKIETDLFGSMEFDVLCIHFPWPSPSTSCESGTFLAVGDQETTIDYCTSDIEPLSVPAPPAPPVPAPPVPVSPAPPAPPVSKSSSKTSKGTIGIVVAIVSVVVISAIGVLIYKAHPPSKSHVYTMFKTF